MKLRDLGRSGIEVSEVCLGGNVFGWTADEATSESLLDAFVAAGGNFIDTANVYSRWVPGHAGGESEAILGRWLKHPGHRRQVVVATKVGGDMGPGRKGLGRAQLMREVDESLRRLQTDHIDLYQSHWDDPDTPLGETLEAYGDLIRLGKVRAVGASNLGAERLTEALETAERIGGPRYETLQPRYNLYDREGYERDLEALCRRHGVGVISYYSLAAGFLTGKYRSAGDTAGHARGATVKAYLDERGWRILQALDEVAAARQATPAQVALAWLLARPGLTAPIVSATSLRQLEQIVAATDLDLTAEEVADLDRASEWRSAEAAQR